MIQKTRLVTTKQTKDASELLKFVPLGGFEEIGRNCSYLEYKNEILIMDMGIQFPEEETPGIDFIIPNVSSLVQKKANILGLLLTHGHLDHISAIPYLIEKIGNPPIYSAEFTKALVEKRHAEFPNVPKLKTNVVKNGDVIKFGKYFEVEFFAVSHTIPDALGLLIKTPVGYVVNFGDFRVDMDLDGKPINLDIFERLGKLNIHTILMDSTNADIPGSSVPEPLVEKTLEDSFKNLRGRVIVATFSSLLDRIAEIIKIAERLGRKVMINGRSMKDNVQIAQGLGYIKTKKGLIIPIEESNKYKDEKILLLSTGGQGEPNSGLVRIANGEHRHLRFKKEDTVFFSSSVVPGNERSVQMLQDTIARQVDEVYNSKLLDIHSSGHAPSEDLKIVMRITKPKFVVPIHAYYFKRAHVRGLAREIGFPEEKVILIDNGQVCELGQDTFRVTEHTADTSYVMVDGLGIGDVEEVVLRDRRTLAAEGMMVMIVTLDRKQNRLLKNPDIISRGFIYLRENQELIDEIRKRIRGILGRLPHTQAINVDYLKTLLRDQIGQFLYTKTRRRPMVIPVIIEV